MKIAGKLNCRNTDIVKNGSILLFVMIFVVLAENSSGHSRNMCVLQRKKPVILLVCCLKTFGKLPPLQHS